VKSSEAKAVKDQDFPDLDSTYLKFLRTTGGEKICEEVDVNSMRIEYH